MARIFHCVGYSTFHQKVGINMDRRIQKTKDSIRSAYLSLLMEKSGPRITIAEIARRANIDRKTFYLHYEMVEDVAREFCQEKINELIFSLEKADFFDQPFHVKNLFHALNALIEQDLELFQHIAGNKDYDFFWEQVSDIIICTIKDVYADQLDMEPAEFDICARFYSAGFVAVYVSWLKKEIPVSLDELGNITGEASYWGAQKLLPEQG